MHLPLQSVPRPPQHHYASRTRLPPACSLVLHLCFVRTGNTMSFAPCTQQQQAIRSSNSSSRSSIRGHTAYLRTIAGTAIRSSHSSSIRGHTAVPTYDSRNGYLNNTRAYNVSSCHYTGIVSPPSSCVLRWEDALEGPHPPPPPPPIGPPGNLTTAALTCKPHAIRIRYAYT